MMRKNILLFLLCFVSFGTYSQSFGFVYQDGEQVLQGYLVRAEKSDKYNAAVLILPAWMGVSDHSEEVAEKLASLGYLALVADIYGDGNNPKTPKEAGKIAGYYKNNVEAYQKRISIALEELIALGANPDKIVIIGFCFGGTGALEAARAKMPVRGVVSFHGGLSKNPDRVSEDIKAKILVLHGADDPYVPASEVADFQNEMRTSNADWQMIYYADAVHAFTDKNAGNDKSRGAAYNEKAAKRSFEHFLVFLNEVFEF